MTSKIKILISDKMSNSVEAELQKANIPYDVNTGNSEDELCKIIENYDGLIIRSATKVTPKVIEHAKKLKIIGRAGIGVDNVNLPSATAAGMIVMNTPHGNSITTAEHAIAMMMAVARKIPAANESTHAGKWEKSKFTGVEITDKTLGVIGCGNIGAIVVNRAKGLKMNVISYDPFLTDTKAKELGIDKVTLDELFEKSDFITLHVPLNDKTKYIIDTKAIAKIKDTAYIINCARGGLIDEKALREALDNGHIAGAAIDVFEEEPAKENILFDHPNVVCTPHLGASTLEAQENVAIQVAEQMVAFFNENTVMNSVNVKPISKKDASDLSPYTNLCFNLGHIISEISENDGFENISIEYHGAVSKMSIDHLTSAVIHGLLNASVESVNAINATFIAKDKNIEISTTLSEKCYDYNALIRVIVRNNNSTYSIAGSMIGKAERIVEINDNKLESSFGDNMIYVENLDAPGIVGNIGHILGKANINIARFHLGRGNKEGNAVSLIEIDSAVTNAELTQIENVEGVKRVIVL